MAKDTIVTLTPATDGQDNLKTAEEIYEELDYINVDYWEPQNVSPICQYVLDGECSAEYDRNVIDNELAKMSGISVGKDEIGDYIQLCDSKQALELFKNGLEEVIKEASEKDLLCLATDTLQNYTQSDTRPHLRFVVSTSAWACGHWELLSAYFGEKLYIGKMYAYKY